MSHHAHITDRNMFGFWVYLMSDCVLFATLFATYMVLKDATYGGTTPEALANLPFVFVETLLLLTSSFTIGLAVLASGARRVGLSLVLLLATLGLGLGFLGMELFEFAKLIAEGEGPARSAFLSAFFTLVGTHGLHVLAGSVWVVALILYIVRKGLVESASRKLLLLSLFWHFLDIIWIFIFTLVYLFGSLSV